MTERQDGFNRTPEQVLAELRNRPNEYALASIMLRVDRDLHKDGWDQPPRLFMVFRTLAPPEALAEIGAHEAMVLEVSEVPLPAGNYDGEVIAFMLAAIVEQLKTSEEARELMPSNIFSWLLVHEAYVTAVGGSHPWLGPGRHEVRGGFAVDNAGVSYTLLHDRATDTVGIDVGHDDDLSGRIYAGLRNLVELTVDGGAL